MNQENTPNLSGSNNSLFFQSSLWGHAPLMSIIFLSAGWLLIALPPIIWFLCNSLLYKKTTLEVKNNSLVYKGFKGYSAVDKEIAVSDIKAIEVNYSLTQMLFGKKYGTLKVATAGTSGYEVEMYGVKHADELRTLWRSKKQG